MIALGLLLAFFTHLPSAQQVGVYQSYGPRFNKCTDNTLSENIGVATIEECASAALAANSQFMQWTNNVNGRCRHGPTCDNIDGPTGWDWQIYIRTTACEPSHEWSEICDNCSCETWDLISESAESIDTIDACKEYAENHGYDHVSFKTRNGECRVGYEIWCSNTERQDGWKTHKLTVEECSLEIRNSVAIYAGNDAIDRDRRDTGSGIQFVSEYEITENGKLVSWEIFVFREVEMVLQVFREQSTPLNYNLVGSTTFQATVGYNQVEANIDVQAGDVLGWYCDGVQAIEFSNGGDVRVRRGYGYTGVEDQIVVTNQWFREYSIQAEILVAQYDCAFNFESHKSCCPSTAGEGGCWQILDSADDLIRIGAGYTEAQCASACAAIGQGCCFLNNNDACYHRSSETLYDNTDELNRAALCTAAESKVINYDDCNSQYSLTGELWNLADPWPTECPANSAVVSVETKVVESSELTWTIMSMQCCGLVDKVTDAQNCNQIPEQFHRTLKGGGYSTAEDQWDAQCGPNAIMVGIWDNDSKGDFDDIDAVKCCTLDTPFTSGEKIDRDDCAVVNLAPNSKSSCPLDYVLVGIYDDAATQFERVRKMKCCRVLESILPTVSPTQMPTPDEPSQSPTVSPTTSIPSMSPTTDEPTAFPSIAPTNAPSIAPTNAPTVCEPTCRSHSDQMMNILGRLLVYIDRTSDGPLKNELSEMILDFHSLLESSTGNAR